MQPINPAKRDPAPSRTSYRMQRLWLTPVFRALLRTGLPVLLVLAAAGWYLSDSSRINKVKSTLADLRADLEHRPDFMVNLMQIEDVSAEVSEDIREVTAIDYPVSSFDLDLQEMKSRVEGLDAVEKADLVIRRGGVLEVRVKAREPALIWRSRDALELLDYGGHRVAGIDERTSRSELPLVVGEGADQAAAEALALFRVAAPILNRIRGLARVGERRWDVVLDRNQRIMLPEANSVVALERALALDEANDLLARDIAAIDIRNPKRVFLRLNKAAIDALRGRPVSANGNGAL